MNPVNERLEQFIDHAWKLKSSSDYETWLRRLLAFINSAIGPEYSEQLESLGGTRPTLYWQEYRDRQASHLEGQISRTEQANIEQDRKVEQAIAQVSRTTKGSNAVFLVHGHDVSAKESTARFLEKLNLKAVILHEQASEGRTIIEKFEANSDVGFAVVLLTPDDVGAPAASSDKLSGRARQNVILELGYFTGKLGRRRVCGLFRPGIELPSDLHGVLFIELDNQGGWKTKLAQELVSAGMMIDLNGLLHS